jgi:hypothetical protein
MDGKRLIDEFYLFNVRFLTDVPVTDNSFIALVPEIAL